MTDLLEGMRLLADFERASTGERQQQWPLIEHYLRNERISHLTRRTLYRGLSASDRIGAVWQEKLKELEISLMAERIIPAADEIDSE